jgi:hypothetical protein
MKFHVGFLIIASQVECKECSADDDVVCLLHLRNGKNASEELESGHRLEADKSEDGGDGLPGADPPFTESEKLRSEKALGEVALEHQVTRGEDADPYFAPHGPKWDEYPSALVDILDTMVVTRWNADKKQFQSRGLSSPIPGLYRQFDCVRHESFVKTSYPCRTLLVENKRNFMMRCSDEIANGTLDVTSGVFVAFLGTDHFLSDRGFLPMVKSIGAHFQRTYYESYDLMDDAVDVLPIGISEYYLRFQDWDVMSDLAQNFSPQKTSGAFPKQNMVLGAFGAFYAVKNPSRKSAVEFCKSHKDETWLTCEEVQKDEWWKTLRSFRFMLNPTGNGAQSSKFYEALLARTIPICTKEPAFLKLHEKGWPMVLVDTYSEVANLDLSDIYEQLAPRLETIQPYLHMDAYWNYLQKGHL